MKRLALALPFMLAACGEPAPEPAVTPTPEATIAGPRTLIAADLDLAQLGARIAGPDGDAITVELGAGDAKAGSLTSYVACPRDMTSCVPAALPRDTIYTYVHRVTLGDAGTEEERAEPADGPEVVENAPTLFRTTRAAAGFNGALGYSQAEALAALGSEDAIKVSNDGGRLIWQVAPDARWKPGSTITFWWQSTEPPAGPQDAYLVEVEGNQTAASGPFPAAPAPVEGSAEKGG